MDDNKEQLPLSIQYLLDICQALKDQGKVIDWSIYGDGVSVTQIFPEEYPVRKTRTDFLYMITGWEKAVKDFTLELRSQLVVRPVAQGSAFSLEVKHG